jgi:hypothetical protein
VQSVKTGSAGVLPVSERWEPDQREGEHGDFAKQKRVDSRHLHPAVDVQNIDQLFEVW